MSTISKLFWGTLVCAVGLSYYLLRKNKKQSYEGYCNRCIQMASAHLKKYEDVQKAILVFKPNAQGEIFPILYVKHLNGKVTKTNMNKQTFPLNACPKDIRDKLYNNDEYIIHKF